MGEKQELALALHTMDRVVTSHLESSWKAARANISTQLRVVLGRAKITVD